MKDRDIISEATTCHVKNNFDYTIFKITAKLYLTG
jgi:hypothetical protein